MNKLSTLLLIFFAAHTVVASGLIGTPNPASKHCIGQGGKLVMTETKHGEMNICHLASGKAIEEWHLYHKNHLKLFNEKPKKNTIILPPPSE